jgi:hypothetical protein
MTQKKLTKENAKSLHEAADIIQGCFNWGDTDEGVHFWGGVVELLRSKASNGTSDGKPWVDPEPAMPEGWRRAEPDEWQRRDVQFWHETEKSWMERPCMGDPFDPPKCNTRYIVPIDPPLTDEDACVWPRLLVMVRDDEVQPWFGPYQYQGKGDAKEHPFVVNSGKDGDRVWKQARRATTEEIKAAK